MKENDKNVIICFDEIPEGYYLDINNKAYKKCYENCKYCYQEENEIFNNCIECIYNYTLLKDSLYKTNCYIKLEYFYYF